MNLLRLLWTIHLLYSSYKALAPCRLSRTKTRIATLERARKRSIKATLLSWLCFKTITLLETCADNIFGGWLPFYASLSALFLIVCATLPSQVINDIVYRHILLPLLKPQEKRGDYVFTICHDIIDILGHVLLLLCRPVYHLLATIYHKIPFVDTIPTETTPHETLGPLPEADTPDKSFLPRRARSQEPSIAISATQQQRRLQALRKRNPSPAKLTPEWNDPVTEAAPPATYQVATSVTPKKIYPDLPGVHLDRSAPANSVRTASEKQSTVKKILSEKAVVPKERSLLADKPSHLPQRRVVSLAKSFEEGKLKRKPSTVSLSTESQPPPKRRVVSGATKEGTRVPRSSTVSSRIADKHTSSVRMTRSKSVKQLPEGV